MVPGSATKRARRRRGLTLLEASAALLVMAAAIVAVVELAKAAGKGRRARQQREVALLELGNQAERVALMPWSETAPNLLTTWMPSEMLQSVVPDPICRVNVMEMDQGPANKQIELSVAWKNAAGEEMQPVSLTVWKFAGTQEAAR